LIGERPHRGLLLVSLPLIVLLFYATASLHFPYTPDDTYIYLQFAKNVDQGNGISFNAGEPTYGFTSPLWMFIIALGGRMGVELYVAAKAIDLVFASLALLTLYLLAFEVIRDVGVALSATVAFSVNAWFLRWSGSGMETSLSVLLTLAAFLFCLRNEYFLSVVFAGLLTLTRPEGALLAGVIVADLVINSVNRRRAVKMGLSLVLIYAALLLPWLVYARATFGTAIPNTALAKAGLNFRVADFLSTLEDTVRTLIAADAVALLALLSAGALLVSHFSRRRAEEEEDAARSAYLLRQSVPGLLWIAGLLTLYVASGANVVSRYLLLATPFITIYAFLFLFEFLSISRWRSRAAIGVIVLTGLIMLQNQFFYHRYVLPGIESFEEGMESCLIPIGRWIKATTPPGSTVLTGDIGAIGYFSERRVCDAAGLVSPALLPLIHEGVQPYEIIKRKMYRGCCSPEYVIHRAESPEDLKSDSGLVPLLTKPFPNMSLTDARTIYYTVYRVRQAAPAESGTEVKQ
jgi:arabinofuranosyltransferase